MQGMLSGFIGGRRRHRFRGLRRGVPGGRQYRDRRGVRRVEARHREGADPHRHRLQGARRVQPGQEELIDSAARVKTLLLQIPTLKINALLAQDDIARLAGLLASQLQEAQDAQAALGRMQQLSNQDPRRDPAYRQYRDHQTTLAVEAFDHALEQLFLVTRALEYEIGMSFGRRGDLFTLVTPAELAGYAAEVEVAYQRYIATVGNAQPRQITLSLRDQIFRFANPLQDNATGGTYQPADVFHRLLAEPAQPRRDGNVRLTFSLSLAPDAFLFNTTSAPTRSPAFA